MTNQTIFKVIIFIGFTLSSTTLFAETVTFNNLARELLSKSAALKVSDLNVQQQVTSYMASRWALSPSLSFGSDRTFRKSHEAGVGAETTTSLSARLNLFDGFADWNNLEIAEISVSRARTEKLEARRTILAELSTQYLDWQRAHQKLVIVSQLTDMRETMLKSIRNTVRTGERSSTDQLLFENLLLQAQERASRTAIEQRQAMISIQKSLSEVMGASFANRKPQEPAVFSIDYCDQSASFSNHPKVQSLESLVTLQKTQRDAIAAEYYPSLDLSAEKRLDQFSTTDSDVQLTWRLSLSWPLYTGLSTHFEQKELGYEIQKTELRKNETQTELILTHQENCERLEAVEDWHQKAIKIAENYKQILTTSRNQYRNGGISTLDLTDQELRLLDAELSLIDARFTRQEVLASQWILHDATFETSSQ